MLLSTLYSKCVSLCVLCAYVLCVKSFIRIRSWMILIQLYWCVSYICSEWSVPVVFFLQFLKLKKEFLFYFLFLKKAMSLWEKLFSTQWSWTWRSVFSPWPSKTFFSFFFFFKIKRISVSSPQTKCNTCQRWISFLVFEKNPSEI